MTKFDAYKLALTQPLRHPVDESVAFGLPPEDISAADLAHSRAAS